MARAALVSAFTKRLEGKVALITGGASGIGEYTARLFSKHGAKVVIADVQEELGHSIIKSIGTNISTFVHCDVTNEDTVKNAVDQTVSEYGKLDILFANAGIVDPPRLRIIDNEKTDFERVLNINVTGVFLSMKHAARVMVPARHGAIISTSSLASGVSAAASHAYTCSKHAVVGLTKNLAVELGQFGIRVNCVSPSALPTPLSKQFMKLDDEEVENFVNSKAILTGTILKADDVANAVLFLASEEAKYVSGQNLFIDGGFGVTNSAFNIFKSPES